MGRVARIYTRHVCSRCETLSAKSPYALVLSRFHLSCKVWTCFLTFPERKQGEPYPGSLASSGSNQAFGIGFADVVQIVGSSGTLSQSMQERLLHTRQST